MTCKLDPSEKASRQMLRYTKSLITQMLTKRVYPHNFHFENGFEEIITEPWGGKEIYPNNMRTIRFSYYVPDLRKRRKK